MTYLSARSRKNHTYGRNILFAIFILALIFAWGFLKPILYPAVLPLVKAYASIRDTGTGLPHNVIVYFTSRNADQKKISELEANIERLENELAFGNADVSGETASTTPISTQPVKTIKTLALYPVVRDITSLYDTVVLSKGFVDGVLEGSIVYVRGYEAVGYITEVHKTTSTMRLYSSSVQKVEGIIKDIDASVTLLGQGGSYLIEVPKTVPVAVGQNVYLSGAPIMMLGTIVEVENDPQDTFTRAYVRGAYSATKAHTYYVDQ